MTIEQRETLREAVLEADWEDMCDYDWGCEYCRNDGKLNANNCCPKCDAQFDTEENNQ